MLKCFRSASGRIYLGFILSDIGMLLRYTDTSSLRILVAASCVVYVYDYYSN